MPSYDVCFVGLKCYDLLSGAEVPRYLGGVEKQLVSLAKGLSRRGHRVSFVTYDHGQPDGIMHAGVTIFRSFSPDAGLPGLRFVHPRMTRLWSALGRADAKVYLQMGAGCETGETAFACRWLIRPERPFVFCVASDGNCDTACGRLSRRRENWLYSYGLRGAAQVVTQTRKQQTFLRAMSGVDSLVIPLSCELSASSSSAPVGSLADAPPRVLWIGRIARVKRLEWLLNLAMICPEIKFDVVGSANANSAYTSGVLARARGVPNVTLHGRVPESQLSGFYRRCFALVCTSVIEGFPTAFLEAWSHARPVITTFDPDDLVAGKGLGWVGHSVDELAGHIRVALASPEAWREASQNARSYYARHHALEAVVPRFEDLFRSAL